MDQHAAWKDYQTFYSWFRITVVFFISNPSNQAFLKNVNSSQNIRIFVWMQFFTKPEWNKNNNSNKTANNRIIYTIARKSVGQNRFPQQWTSSILAILAISSRYKNPWTSSWCFIHCYGTTSAHINSNKIASVMRTHQAGCARTWPN